MRRRIRWAASSAASMLFAAARGCGARRQQYILVIAHMRSGSTLLHHLLLTNPAIIGAGESNRIYKTTLDLRRLSLWAHRHSGSLLRWRSYATDQINHTPQLGSALLLDNPAVRTVFLIREPRGAIGSLVKLFGRYHEQPLPYAMDYYCERLTTLQRLMIEFSELQPRRAFGVTYQSLATQPEATLASLQRHFALPFGFRRSYALHPFTGIRGDPSQKITTGTVQSPDQHSELELPAAAEDELRSAYARAFSAMRQHCVMASCDANS